MGVLAVDPLIFGDALVMWERDGALVGLDARELIREPARDPRRELLLNKAL